MDKVTNNLNWVHNHLVLLRMPFQARASHWRKEQLMFQLNQILTIWKTWDTTESFGSEIRVKRWTLSSTPAVRWHGCLVRSASHRCVQRRILSITNRLRKTIIQMSKQDKCCSMEKERLWDIRRRIGLVLEMMKNTVLGTWVSLRLKDLRIWLR